MDRISTILKKYISERIPKKVTNVIWQLFNGCEAMFVNIEYRLDIFKRERNILTAQSLSSLRNLAAQNGFEPTLMIPSSGTIQMKVNPKLFNRCGYPLFLPPYSIFTDKQTLLKYYYDSNKTLKINDNILLIPVVEGELKSITKIADSNNINRFYLEDSNISNGSISIIVNNIQYTEVKSFSDNLNLNDNKQFIVKFGSDMLKPIVLYVKGLNLNDTVEITYRLTNGEAGNISDTTHNFETESIIDSYGNIISADDDEVTIINQYGFSLGSNGTDENTLRSAIGYNHGQTLLFDNKSYSNFIGKYSTILLQKILNPIDKKTINNIYLFKKQSLNETIDNIQALITEYKSIIDYNKYLLSDSEKQIISSKLEENEYALTSHNIFNAETCKYAFQITFKNSSDKETYSDSIKKLLYIEFGKFLYNKAYSLNIEILFKSFMENNNVDFSYSIFNEIIEKDKITNKTDKITPYIINHTDYLPILKGDFNICDSDYNSLKLFFDINIVIES